MHMYMHIILSSLFLQISVEIWTQAAFHATPKLYYYTTNHILRFFFLR